MYFLHQKEQEIKTGNEVKKSNEGAEGAEGAPATKFCLVLNIIKIKCELEEKWEIQAECDILRSIKHFST